MRGRLVLALSAIALAVGFSVAAAEVVVLKDGRSIPLAKPLVAKGKMAILTLPDKTVLSVPLSEIDKEKTAEARSRAAAPPPEPKRPSRPMTPAEAAKVKSTRKAIVSLTDDSVAHPTTSSPEGAPADEQSSKVEMGPTTVKREASGYSITGSLMNAGKGEAIAVTLTVEAVGDDGKTVSSSFASIAKDTLTAGEKTTFSADLPTSVAVTNFKYQPRWKEKLPSRLSIASGSGNGQAGDQQGQQGQQGQGQQPGAQPEGQPAAPAPKPEEAKPVPRPDVAAPTANAPVGQPTEPGGAYLPQPSAEGQPKLP